MRKFYRFKHISTTMLMMDRTFRILLIFLILINNLIDGCLITNCPRGGKRGSLINHRLQQHGIQIKQCVSCGPGHSGQCFGPQICCGPFGCLLNTIDTVRCQKDGNFHQNEPCIAGFMNCHRFNGRCATDNICCNQDSCYIDKTCNLSATTLTNDNDKNRNLDAPTLDLYNFFNYPIEQNISE